MYKSENRFFSKEEEPVSKVTPRRSYMTAVSNSEINLLEVRLVFIFIFARCATEANTNANIDDKQSYDCCQR